MTDDQALHLYATRADPAAFAQLVGSHANLVYAAALRQVDDPGLAEDVAQAVFILLSQRAARIRSEHLAGWLVRTTHFASKDAIKRRRRRAYHEEQAMFLRPEFHTPEQSPEWSDVAPHLDAALARLRPTDRTAIALRYIENRSVREVAAAMHITEPAAGKRLQRAIARLRKRLAAHLPTASVVTLAALLTNHASAAAPPVLLTSTPSALATAIAKSTGRLLKLVKLKAAAFSTVAAAALAAATLLFAQSKPVAAAPATEPAAAFAYHGILLDESNHPLPNAPYTLTSTLLPEGPANATAHRTGPDGSFTIPVSYDRYPTRTTALFNVPGHTLAWKSPEGFIGFPNELHPLQLRPSASVSGTVTDTAGHPVSNAAVELQVFNPSDHQYQQLSAETGFPITTDAHGQFHIDRLPADVPCRVAITAAGFSPWESPDNPGAATSASLHAGGAPIAITLQPGATLRVQLTRDGKPFPLAGVKVTAEMDGVPRQQGVTDASGAARIPVAAGAWRVHAEAAPGSPTIVPAAAIDAKVGENPAVTLDAPARTFNVTGTLLCNDQPASHLYVEALAFDGDFYQYVAITPTDDHGRFTFHLPTGKYKLLVEAVAGPNAEDNEITQDIDVANADLSNVEMSIKWAQIWQGRLVDEAGQPVFGAVDDALTYPDGHFVFYSHSFRPSQVFSAFSADRKLAAVVVGDSYATPPEEFVLHPAATVTGQVLNVDGTPAAGATIVPEVDIQTTTHDPIHPGRPGLLGSARPVWNSLGEAWQTTADAQGKFTLTGVPAGTTLINATAAIPPGGQYSAETPHGGPIMEPIVAGETRDVGTIQLRVMTRPPATGTRSAGRGSGRPTTSPASPLP